MGIESAHAYSTWDAKIGVNSGGKLTFRNRGSRNSP